MNKTKVIAMLLSAAMSTSFAGVCYADGDENWTISYVDGDSDKADRSTYYAKITDESDIAPGENLILVDYGGTNAQMGKESYVELTAALTEDLVAGNEYTLSFLAKGYFNNPGATGFGRRHPDMAEFRVGDQLSYIITDLTKTDLGDSWCSYSKTFTYDGTESNVKIRVYGALGGNNKTVFDDISLKDSSANELVKNPYFALQESLPEEYYASGFYAYPDGGKATLGWVNPKARGLMSVALYERVGTERILLKNNFTTQAEASVSYSFGSFDDSTTLNPRLFEVEFNFRNKAPYVYYLSLAPTDETSVKESLGFDWQVGKNTSGLMTTARYSYRRAYDNPHSGDSYLNMNLSDGTGALDISCILSMPFEEPLEVGEKYKVSLYYRAQGAGFASHLTLGGDPIYWAVGDSDGYQEVWNTYTTVGSANNWNLYEKEITATNASTNMFFIHFHNRLDIDDVSVCKINEDGSLGENLVLYGDCEGVGSTEVGTIRNAQFKNIETDNMTLSYDAGANVSYIDVYKEQDGEYVYSGKISPVHNELYIDKLTLGTEYTYRLTPYNADDVAGESVDVTGKTLIPDYTIEDITLLKNGTETAEITGSGTYTVKTVVTDYLVEDMKYAQVVAVYKDNTLQKLYNTEHSFTAEGADAQGNEIQTTDIEIGNGSGWTIEVHMWDSIEDMNILYPCVTFAE